MGLKSDDSCLAKAKDDEPIFVLRSTDRLAPDIVREWAKLAERGGTDRGKIEEAYRLAGRMEDWASANGGSKHPD